LAIVCFSVLPSLVLLIHEKYWEYDGVRSLAPGKTFASTFSAAWQRGVVVNVAASVIAEHAATKNFLAGVAVGVIR
jgi:hypothetical protein